MFEGKGDEEDLHSFLSCYEDEAKTAAYLRFDDMGDFRRMKLSYPVLEAFLQLKKHRFPRKEDVLEVIRDTASSLDYHFPPGVDPTEIYEVFDGTFESAEDRETNEIAKTLQSTMVLVELVRALQALDSISAAEKQLKQAAIVQEFETATGYTFPSAIYDVITVPPYTFRPTRLVESMSSKPTTELFS